MSQPQSNAEKWIITFLVMIVQLSGLLLIFNTMLSVTFRVGWQVRSGFISLGRDKGWDTTQWIISAFNGLEVA